MECKVSDLVKRGHDQAAELKSSCGAVDVRDVAQLISDLATQLDVQLVRSNALAAENAALMAAKEIIRHLNVNREEANFCGIDDCYIDDAVAAMITPATDAFLAEVRAQGVEMFSEKFGGGTLISDMVKEVAKDFAAQLRKGVQS
ncbi:hypothetical protein ABDA14_003986 [Salmonella enterica]|nr:hypothetical protein [Salmonella enterica subsp. enterica serovar Panama]EGA5781787.1 hypothetical protein [Salmonella enterica]EKQ4834653.1 hypothetical protein [Salmonella enterica]ELM7660609.1 hypothetical protein [Salmonella enterica]